MDSAIDLFRAGATVPAREIDHVAAATMRIVCPKCMERVHLVVRDTGSHFAHEPQTDVSPGCPLRVHTGHGPAAPGGRHEPLPPNTRFRDALLAAFGLTKPPPADDAAATAASIMHRVYLSHGRTVRPSDLPDASPLVRDWWRSDADMIRGFLERPGVLSQRLDPGLQDRAELNSEAHRQTVLLLWKHLHSPQVADDLLLLLSTTRHLFHPQLTADLVLTSLGVLTWVPWAGLWSTPTALCGLCGRKFQQGEGNAAVVCSECGRDLCPDCVNQCTGCGDWLCEDCIFDACPACGDSLCLTCTHLDWECAWCRTVFCRGGLHGEAREEVDQTECEDCGETFCPECVDSALVEFAGELLCETCHDERLGEQGAVIQELS